jgi:two-component system cell cycle sensor histidine kinase/response regulator CckA
MNPYALLSLLGFAIFLFLGAFVLFINPRQRMNQMFMILCTVFAYWGITEFGFRNAHTYEEAILWFKLFSFWHVSLAILVHFVLVFTEKKRLLKHPLTYAALYGPALALVALDFIKNSMVGTPVQAPWGWTFEMHGSLRSVHFMADALWIISSCLTATVLSVSYYFSIKNKTRKKQAKYVALGLCIPILTGLVTYLLDVYTSVRIPEFTTSTFAITSLLIGYGIWKHRLFTLTAANAAENIISTMSDGLIIVNNEDRIQMVNDAACRMLETDKASLVGRPLDDIFADTDLSPALSDRTWFFTMLSAGSISDIQMSLAASGGRIVPVSMSASALRDDGGEIAGMVFICRDVTERKHAEEALRATRDELEAMVAQRTAELEQQSEQLKLELANRMMAEEEVRNSEKRYRAIVEDHTELICRFLPDTTLTFVNAAFCRYFGTAQEELVGHPLRSLIAAPDQEAFVKHIAELAMTNRAAPLECRVRAHSGAERWQQLIVRPLYDEASAFIEFQAIGVDVTDRKAAEDALAAEKERLAVTLTSIADGVITTDTSGKILLINNVAGQLTGWRQDEASGRHIDDCLYVVNERTMSRHDNPLGAIIAKQGAVSFDEDVLLVARDGARRSISYVGAPIRDRQDSIIGMVLVFRDITDRRTLENELFKSRKLESMGVLAAGIAGDFSAILSDIITHLFTAKIYLKAGDDSYRHITDAEAAAFRASRLTKQLLTFSKGGAPVKERASIRTLIEDSVGFSLSGSSASYRLDLPDDLLPVEIDRGQIDQVISNIVINADQAMPEGGTITVRAQNVTIGANSEQAPTHIVHASNLEPGSYVCISVIDEGAGIPKENLEKIFDPYFTTKPNCNGLGLTSAYSIVKKHNGYITVSSEPGKGAAFSVYLPALIEKPAEEGTGAAKRKKLRLLVLDEDESVRETAGGMLKKFGFDVEYAQQWDELFARYKSAMGSQHPFVAVFVDWDGGSEEYLRMLHGMDPGVKVLVSTRDPASAAAADLGRFGVVDSVLKPFSIEALSAALQKAVKVKIAAAK